MTSKDSNAPLLVVRDGALKASVWENKGENSSFLSISLAKTYTKDGQPRDGHHFSRSDMLPLSELMRTVYARTARAALAGNKPEEVSPRHEAE